MSRFDPEVATEIEDALDHLNERHGDTILFLTAFAGGQTGLAHAELAHAEPTGLEVRAAREDGSEVQIRLPFREAVNSLPAVRAQLLEFLRAARSRAGDVVPLTSFEREMARRAQLSTFVTAVARVEDLTPGLRQVTVRGGLAGFEPLGGDQFVYVMVPERESIDLWIVLHDHGGGVSAWARRAAVGDPVALWGPRVAFTPPATTRSFLLVGDETGLPAIAAILDELGPAVTARVVLETVDAGHVVALPGGPNVSITWLFRGGDEPGTGSRLLDLVRELDLDPDGLYVFGAAEPRQIAALRRHLRVERGLSADRVRLTGYWRRGPRRAR